LLSRLTTPVLGSWYVLYYPFLPSTRTNVNHSTATSHGTQTRVSPSSSWSRPRGSARSSPSLRTSTTSAAPGTLTPTAPRTRSTTLASKGLVLSERAKEVEHF
jgi:hypothetical protein